MLQPLAPTTTPLQPQSYFYDPLHHVTYYLQEGQLRSISHDTQKQQNIHACCSSALPSYPHPPRLLSVEGDIISNTSGTIISLDGQSAIVRSSSVVVEGSCWQWHAPLGLESIELGICIVKDKEPLKYEMLEFNSSTSRTITFLMKQSSADIWVNGTRPRKSTIPFSLKKQEQVHPAAKIKGKGNTLVFVPFLTTPLGISTPLSPPKDSDISEEKTQHLKLTHLYQLDIDRMLLVWQSNRITLLNRDQKTNQFDFPTASIHGKTFFNLFSEAEYQLLKQWRQEKELFKASQQQSLENINLWLRYLIQELETDNAPRRDINELLHKKVLRIRPYLHLAGIISPNLSLHLQEDVQPYLSALRYYDGYSRTENYFLFLSSSTTEHTIQGEIKEVTPNYLLTQHQNTLIIYHLGTHTREIFRQEIDKNYSFNKIDLISSFDEKDLRYFQKEGCHLHKMLTSVFSKRKQDENYVVNQKDVKELKQVYGIEEKVATEALECTGNVEEALVWIYTDHPERSKLVKNKTGQSGPKSDGGVSMIELSSKFTRLLLSVNRQIFILGILPSQLSKYIYLGQNQYIDLTSFKHEPSLSLLPYSNWYNNIHHPTLSILDSLQTKNPVQLLLKEANDDIYYISINGQSTIRQKVEFDEEQLYEKQSCLNLGQSEKIEDEKGEVIRTIKGQLIAGKDKQYRSNTSILVDGHLHSNCVFNTIEILRVTADIPRDLLPPASSGQPSNLSLTVESGPPGVNKNYLLTSILQPNISFLGNYPHGLRLRNVHGLLMRVNSISLNRCIGRKNINIIESGKVCCRDLWGNNSNKIPFQFKEGEEQLTVEIEEHGFCREIVLEFQFTTFKKLPFEIGTITAQGSTISSDAFQRHLKLTLTKIVNKDVKERIFVLNNRFFSTKTIQFDITSSECPQLEDIVSKNAVLKIIKLQKLVQLKSESTFEELESQPPQQLLNYMTKNVITLQSLLLHLSESPFFTLQNFKQGQVRKLIDLVVLMPQNIKNESYYERMFSKLWNNHDAKEYLLSLADSLAGGLNMPLPYLKLLIRKMSTQQHQNNLKDVLATITNKRSKQYATLQNEQPYLYFQNQLYSPFYYSIIDPELNKLNSQNIFSAPVIKAELAVFKGEFTKTVIVKLPTEHRIVESTLRVQSCEMTSKVQYSLYALKKEGKVKVGAGCVQEHQWSQISKIPINEEENSSGDRWLNMIGLQVDAFNGQYLQMELKFTETGIIAHSNELSRIPEVDILPEFYGYDLGISQVIPQIDATLTFTSQEMFFLSIGTPGSHPLKKYSVSRSKNKEFIYLTPFKQDTKALISTLTSKIEKKQLQSVVVLQKKLIKEGHFSPKMTLDYLYTLVFLSLSQLLEEGITLPEDLADELFTVIVQGARGPIRMLTFKAISSHIKLLIKSLQFIEYDMATLGPISFSYQQLLASLDFNNKQLCKSLTRLILKGVPYEQKWAELLINMSENTLAHKQIINYFIEQQWLSSSAILKYLAQLPDNLYDYFLQLASFSSLCKLVLLPSSKPRINLLLQAIVNAASETKNVDLDVVSLIFQQDPVRWEQLEQVISCCPQASDVVVRQFLQNEHADWLAQEHPILLARAATAKYAEEFAIFLDRVYQKDKNALAELFLSLNGVCTTLHYDFLETIARFITDLCHLGGLEGTQLISQQKVQQLTAALEMLKVVQKIPEGAELPNQELFLEWYLRNNDYELTTVNPAHKSHGHHVMRLLIDQVLILLAHSSPSKVLQNYSIILNTIQHCKKLSLARKHLMFNQLHHGASKLLSNTLTPGSLSEVLIGGAQPLLANIVMELKSSVIRRAAKNNTIWKPQRQVDLTDKYVVKNIGDVKDIQVGKGGSKNNAFKIPITQKNIQLVSQNPQQFNKVIIGFCLNDHADNKTAILPSKVELFGGNENGMLRVGELIPIEDQYFMSFGVRLFGLNFNSVHSSGLIPFSKLQFKLQEPHLTSVSQLLQSTQKSKKGSTFNISLISLYGYDNQPTDQPDYSSMYLTLLSFLGQKKYRQDLRKVISSSHYDQKMELIIQVLNDLLPNPAMQDLLLALNQQGQNILDHVLKSKGANPRLVSLLVLGKLTKDNINKLLVHTIDNINQELVDICTLALRLASYQHPTKAPLSAISDFNNIGQLLDKYEKQQKNRGLYKQLICSILTVPNLYNYDISKLIDFVWQKIERQQFYSILAGILPTYPKQLTVLAKNVPQLLQQLTTILAENQTANSVIQNPRPQMELLCTMILDSKCREVILESKAPIIIANLLKSSSSILVKYEADTMRLLLNFFQSTCIGSNCQEQFSQILIQLMTTLNDFDSYNHHFFIHSFFFPLINVFRGIPLIFISKHQNQHIKQVTDVLRWCPIRTNADVFSYEGKAFHPLSSIDEQSLTSTLLFVQKDTNKPCYILQNNILTQLSTKKERNHQFKEGKLTVTISENKEVVITPEQFTVYQQNPYEQQLLTNLTLIQMNNPWILPQQYQSLHPLQSSTFERVYFVPRQMKLLDLLKQINIGGFKIHSSDLPNINIANYYAKKPAQLSLDISLSQILSQQEQPYLKLELEASQLFKSTTIESLSKEQTATEPFVAQQTIFKAFEEKQGLQKMITTLKGCVKNWQNSEQSRIWGQYLRQLESYSCFPVFSSLYVNHQSNVSLLFDLLLGLPDKQDSKKWLAREKQSVKQLYSIIKDVFAVSGEQAIKVREYAIKSGFYSTMLDRLHIITKEPKRFKVEQDTIEEEEELPTIMQKKSSEDEYKMKLQKKQGVGYGTDSSTNQKWDVNAQHEARKEQSEQILGLINILQQFLDCPEFTYPAHITDQTFESSLLPILQSSLRGGSLLEISKYSQLFQGELNFIQVLSKHQKLVSTLMSIPKKYQPKQPESLHSLLKTLANTSQIFISCLTGSASQKVSEEIAKKILKTYQIVDEAVSSFGSSHNDEEQQRKIMELPLPKKYPLLMKDLRFDYINMKENGKISKHHYGSNYQSGHKPPVEKTIRLAQELADISHALPIDHTNAIYVRCDKERVDFMQALIMGSNGTPYGHGAYLFDIYFEDSYPNNPPKVNLMTTGSGQVRFNPNLYACGKVCLSLLGTWRGQAMENWDAKVSTLLQVLVSIQSIIMSEDIYFNEPGFEHEQGSVQGEKKNEAYANIVRYTNIKYAMLENIKNPPKGFESVIRRHFYLKKDEILEQCRKWQKLAEKREASYTGLISDHNYNWCNTFKKSKTQYKTMLDKAIAQLQIQLNKLPIPTHHDFDKKNSSPTKQKKDKRISHAMEAVIEEIDVSYGDVQQWREMDINDQKVKDRWSRYIGAMGVQAVTKQSKANIVLLGLGGLGVQIAKNIVLSGCRELSIFDDKNVSYSDLSGQFFLSEEDVGKSRLQSTFSKLQELNNYVKLTKLKYNPEDFSNIKDYQVVVATERTHDELLRLDEHCRNNKINLIVADCYGPYGQIFNDFGDGFEVLDKDGEEPVEVLIEDISIAEKGVVKLVKGHRHPYSDGDTVRIQGVKGMKQLDKQELSINGTIHTITTINAFSFEIGNTTGFTPYEGQGTAKNIKTPSKLSFKSLQSSVKLVNIDDNLQFYDWAKNDKLRLLHKVFLSLSDFIKEHTRLPGSWKQEDADALVEYMKKRKPELDEKEIDYVKLFSYTCSGTFGPICAFFGGLVAQETFKAITGKYTPIQQYFLAQFSQIIQTLPEDQEERTKVISNKTEVANRTQGLRTIVGEELLKKIENSKVFMIGSGAIGCQLLKNFAMIQLGAGQESGSIVVTDPDHIENSNLNRQFLFREKHIRKPKSATASAAVAQMNPRLKGHIKPRLDKVCQATKQIYSNQFFQSQTMITNALDNVEARRYVDGRCVENKVPLLESGTLSSKGHVQVIIPYKTETYGSMQDPNDAQGQIPHCTLKMFPQETLHCVEWARDLFGKEFTLNPKALRKLLQEGDKYTVGPSDIQVLRQCIKLIENRPTNFDDAVYMATKTFYQLFRNDPMQLVYTYPLDSKTKDGKPFWKLPKRPPVAITQIDPQDTLTAAFISSYAVLLAKVYGVPYPKDFRDVAKRQQITKMATSMKVDEFVPSDKAAKEMAQEVDKEGAKDQPEEATDSKIESEEENEHQLLGRLLELVKEIKDDGDNVEAKPEDFQKDDDQNGHIDLIYSMANLRARNYTLEEMDWITVKLKAGRIMPALSTTTSCIAALQTIQLVKYLRGCPVDAMRNSFLNLAIPSLTMGEPGPVEKIKVHEKLETNLWERWHVGPIPKTASFGDLLQAVEQKYQVKVKGLNFCEGGQVYSDFVMSLESKKQEKEKLLKRNLFELIFDQTGEQASKFVDMTLVMGVGQTMIKHAPTLRVLLQS